MAIIAPSGMQHGSNFAIQENLTHTINYCPTVYLGRRPQYSYKCNLNILSLTIVIFMERGDFYLGATTSTREDHFGTQKIGQQEDHIGTN